MGISRDRQRDTNQSSTAKLLEQFKPAVNFCLGLPKNIALAMATTPPERLALSRIDWAIHKPNQVPPSYWNTIKELGVDGLKKGMFPRTVYCVSGNFLTLVGLSYFGDDFKGIIKTTFMKNAIYPLFLWSNAAQMNYGKADIYKSVFYGSLEVKAHSMFYMRNFVANYCLLPGFWVRDKSHQALGGNDDTIPRCLGMGTSLAASTLANTILKPYFTNPKDNPFLLRDAAARKFPGLLAILGREIGSLGLIYLNSPAKTPKVEESNPEAEVTARPR